MTLTLDLSELRTASEEAFAQLQRAPDERFEFQLAEVESFLLSMYRIAVLAVRKERQIERAAAIWKETLEVIDSTAKRIQRLSPIRKGGQASLDRILEIRSAASEMLALYA